jgi:hypothetical protein
MRSTRGKLRSDAHSGQHYTDGPHRYETAPLRSNTPIERRLGNSGPTNMMNSSTKGWRVPSMNYRGRERGYSA